MAVKALFAAALVVAVLIGLALPGPTTTPKPTLASQVTTLALR